MASVIEKETPTDINLAYALGIRRVPFGDLSQSGADDLLRTTLQQIDLRELRGFSPLRELLTFSPGSFLVGAHYHTIEVETLQLKKGVIFPKDAPADLDTYALSLSSRYLEIHPVFKQYESDKETSSWEVAHSWGGSAYHQRGSTLFLALRRPRNHSGAEENLLLVKTLYEKVPREERHIITSLAVTNPKLEDLRTRFKGSYTKIAIEILRQLKLAYSETVRDLQHKCDRAKTVEAKLERIVGSLTT